MDRENIPSRVKIETPRGMETHTDLRTETWGCFSLTGKHKHHRGSVSCVYVCVGGEREERREGMGVRVPQEGIDVMMAKLKIVVPSRVSWSFPMKGTRERSRPSQANRPTHTARMKNTQNIAPFWMMMLSSRFRKPKGKTTSVVTMKPMEMRYMSPKGVMSPTMASGHQKRNMGKNYEDKHV